MRRLLSRLVRTKTPGKQEKSPPPAHLRATVRRHLTFYPDLNVVYFRNAKCGTSTFLKTLWTATDRRLGTTTFVEDVRDHENAPAQTIRQGNLRVPDPDVVLNAAHFTVVRHPLVRLVSGYIEKVNRPPKHVWQLFCARHGLPLDAQISFPEFVELIAADDPQMVDRHFRPQSINIAWGYVPYSHIGQLEALDQTARFLAAHDVPSVLAHRPHATGAAERLRGYLGDPTVLKRAVDFFEADFETLNYAPSLENLLPLSPIEPPEADIGPLRAILAMDARQSAPV
ncbi:sulfotransferase family 2 domain-containing protein [Microbaculum sp. FT89]|uniref:sulfotransferase family 2 domain-containing protein n=1 Tax=Microbaculum sp. FT89 TaxID=3447298 RepID=UPI003F52A872